MKKWIMLLLLPGLLLASYFSDAMRAYKGGNYKEALKLFQLAVEEDGAEQAHYFLGLLYLKGQGVKKDHASAEKYLVHAAAIGNARAKCYLAELYLSQKKPERSKALKLLKEGAAAGASECQAIASKFKISL